MKIFTRLALCLAAGSLLLAGCGKDGKDGAAGKDATTVVKVSSLTTDEWAALAPKGEVLSVSINSPPVVKFKVTDANGNPVVGLGNTSKGTASNSPLLPQYTNISFSLAKLVPGTNGAPSKWVSYIVTTAPTVGNPTPTTGGRPTTDNTGTLVDHGDGTYTYTFNRDITKVKDVVAGYTDSGNFKKADLGDLTYEPNRTHRLYIQISGNARGTGNNTPDAVTVTTGVPLVDPANIIYDFVPATGKAAADNSKREIVTTANCNECHGKLNGLGFHGGSRNDTRGCVICHTDQRKYGQAAVTSDANNAFPAIKTTVSASGSLSFDKTTYIADGEVQGNFPVFIHKIHMGNQLSKTNYNYQGVLYDKLGYSMIKDDYYQGTTNCRKCHRGDTDAQKAAAPQANNWKDAPSRLACGSCHDGINWATGKGTARGAKGIAAGGHLGGTASDDSNCILCHKAADVELYHTNNYATPNNPSVPAGVAKFTYEIASVTVNASNQPVVKWRIKKDGVALTSFSATGSPITGFDAATSPAFLFAYAVPQDGETVAVDYNNNGRNPLASTTSSQPGNVTLKNLVQNSAYGDLGTPDSEGYFTSTFKDAAAIFPAGAKMRTVALQGYFYQDSNHVPMRALSAVKTVTGDTVRRQIIDNTKCGACHEQFFGHGGGRVIGLGNSPTDINVCVLCHNPNITSSGRTLADSELALMSAAEKALMTAKGYGFAAGSQLSWPEDTNNLKDMIHGIHAGKDRKNPLEFVRNSASRSSVTYWNFGPIVNGTSAGNLLKIGVGYPNLLKNCESCHVSGKYSEVPTGALVTTNLIDNATSPKSPASYKAARKTMPNTGFDLVTTPYTASCVSCHDTAPAQAHMTLNGGKIKQARANGMAAGEACITCHGAGKDLDPAKVHK